MDLNPSLSIKISMNALEHFLISWVRTYSERRYQALQFSGLPAEESARYNDPDIELILKYQQGDTQAFETLFHKWKRPLISFLYRSIGNITEAEELALEVFVKVHQSIDRYKPTAKFSSYLFFIGRRLMLNHFRKNKRKPLDIIDPSDLSFIQHTTEIDDRSLREMEEMFQAALMKLPELQRTTLLLLTQQQLQPQEISEIIGKKPSATRVMIHRAREALKIELENLK